MLNKRFIFLVSIVLFTTHALMSTEEISLKKDDSVKKTHTRTGKKKIKFEFTDKPLVDIINELAQEKKLNIILPQGDPVEIKTKVTYHLKKPLTLAQAWKEVISLLDLAGYTMQPQGTDMLLIRKVDDNIKKQITSIFIDQPLDKLPDNENFIRAVFYLANINLKNESSWGDLNPILTDMLSAKANIQVDKKTNALILTDKATNIKSVMKIVLELDKGGPKDSIEVIPLYYTSADDIQKLFDQLLAPRQQPVPGAPPVQEQASYFPKNTRIIALPRNNNLVIMGTPYTIDLVRDFIIKYIDRPLESGESILHIYDLQYLDAQQFQPVLQQIVSPGQTGQSTGQAVAQGPKQYFQGVIIAAEKTSETEQLAPSTVGTNGSTAGAQPQAETAKVGGNRLLIAARKKDWIRIKQLIEDLDKPQPQISLEVLVADITLNSDKLLGSQMRNKQGWNDAISQGVDWQSAQLNQPVLKAAPINPDGTGASDIFTQLPADALMSNLLQLNDPFGNGQNLASVMTPGSLVFSLKDSANNGIWSVWQFINNYTTATLIAQPFVVTKNHQQASVTIAQQRFVAGKADTSNTAVNVANEWITAAFTIDILPHISSSGNVNLQVVVKINQFASSDVTNNTRLTRLVQTNANVGDGQILALGGLTRESTDDAMRETPVLGNFPILGWFFKAKQKIKERNNLIIFIRPVIDKEIVGGTSKFTQRKLAYAKDSIDESLCFENLNDPITRWFFKPDPFYAKNTIDEYKHITQKHREPSGKAEDVKVLAEQSVDKKTIRELVKNETNPLLNTQEEKSVHIATTKSSPARKERSVQEKRMHDIIAKEASCQDLKLLLEDAENPLLANSQA
ncbi:MAG: secretin N-terminal domain-containing protein [Candidatus Babeliales bacterium]